MEKLRVVQWTTGKVGSFTLRAILDDPRLELVGVYAHSADKAGQDAGALCGRPVTGVIATSDINALIASKPDTVIYTPFTGDVDDVVRLLENGADVISTNLFFHVGGINGAVRDRFEVAGQSGHSSLYITGVNPGWINAVAATMTAVCSRVQSVAVYESANCASYESPSTWNHFGMGQHGVPPERMEAAQTWLVMFRDALVRMGDALEYSFDEIEFYCDYATAAEDVDLGWFRMDKGTNAALRGGWIGKIGGREVARTQVTWYLTRHLAEGWEIDDDEYHVIVEGYPGVDMRVRYKMPAHWTHSDWDSITAMPTVNAILAVKAARPGVLALRDVGLPHAPAGIWNNAMA